jgi:hypothetical protein
MVYIAQYTVLLSKFGSVQFKIASDSDSLSAEH